jgi:hypothetical protein
MPWPDLCVQNLYVLSTLVVSSFYKGPWAALDPCSLPRGETQEENLEVEGLDKGASSRAALLNFPDVTFAESTEGGRLYPNPLF